MKLPNPNPNLPTIIYFNGLGDGQPRFREDVVLLTASLRGFPTYRMNTNWYSAQPYEERLRNDADLALGLLEATNAAQLIFVGSSAGVSHAINTYADVSTEADILGVVGLSGRTTEGNLPFWDYRTLHRMAKKSPAFAASVRQVPGSVAGLSAEQLNKIVLVHHNGDEAVPHTLQKVAGTQQKRVIVPGHGPGILAGGLILPRIIKQHLL